MTRAAPPSGKQFALRSGDAQAVITEVGAGLRSYAVAGREVLDGYGIDQMCSDGRGQALLPWPNRIADGSYRFQGVEHQLPLTEPDKRNAIHGLTRWASWHGDEAAPSADSGSIRLQHVLHPQPGYPFMLRCEITYRLGSAGLRVETRATNIGADPCPYATGAHPYISLGTDLVDELTVELPASTYCLTDERGMPVDRRPVEGTAYDLRTPTRLGPRQIDQAFTDLARGSDGGTTVAVRAPGGRGVDLWMDGAYRYVQLYTGDAIPVPERRRRGLAVEPMTAPANAFRTGDGLLTLQPGESAESIWELRPCTP